MKRISSWHFAFFIIIVCNISSRSYASIFLELGGRDTWIALIIAAIIFIMYSSFIIYVCKKTDNFDIKEVFKSAFPKPIYIFILMLFTITIFLNGIESASIQSDAVHCNIFLETPTWYTLIFFIIPAIFIITISFEALLITTIIIVILLTIFVILVEILAFPYKDFTLLTPIMQFGINKDFIECIFISLGAYSSALIVYPFLKNIDAKKRLHLSKHVFLGNLFVTFLCILSAVAIISTFGPTRGANIYYPEFIKSKRIQNFGFIELGDLLFIVRFTSSWLIKYVICAISIIYLHKNLITNKKLFIIFYSLSMFIVSYIIADNHYFLFSLLKYYQYIMLVTFFIMPFIAYLIYYIKWRNKLIPKITIKKELTK